MLIDFHTHTSASDGALAPADLVQRAEQRGVAMLAITDHDTMQGYLAVRDSACARGEMRLIAGIELSCRWAGVTIHVVGLGVDADSPAMGHALSVMGRARRERAEKIAQRLAARGFEGALEGALARAGESQVGRPHFAQWMVEQGHVADHNAAFDRHLGQGKTGDVKAFWPELAEAVNWINGAGGVAVLAHPYKYKFTGMKLRRLIVDFVEAGGAALEVQSGHQTPQQLAQLRRYAEEFALEVSIGSDFHRDGPFATAVGVEVPPVDELQGVWQRWL